MNQDKHATDEELAQFAEFHLNLTRADEVLKHLRQCPSCNARYRAVAKDWSAPVPKIDETGGM